ncbi:MAG: cupin-like domain-containing protein [Chloroflexota bacterium]
MSTAVGGIRAVDIADLSGDADTFFQDYGHEPVVIRGLHSPIAMESTASVEGVARLFSGLTIWAVDRETQAHVEVPSADFFAGFAAGDTRYNVVDHPVEDSPFGESFRIPWFLDANWLSDEPRLGEKCLVATAAGSYTPLHVDSYGFSGWMYLMTGCKEWQFFPPRCRGALYDPLFKDYYDPRGAEYAGALVSHADRFPLASLVQREALSYTLRPGELVLFPGGWMHRVYTPESSLGVGGNVLNAHLAPSAMHWWLVDSSMSYAGSFNLAGFMRDRLERVPTDSPERPALKRALALRNAWVSRMHETGLEL